MLEWILMKLKEPSTKAGLVTLVSLIGLKFSPEFVDAIFAFIIVATNLWQIGRKEIVKK